ncbi:MAG: helix-turn-helix transcriptional regulator [Ruminococcaceae bacterium]|nr:helix-turn-helix transcriptional regulator [Oscillospiraceae bacterium]
MQLFEISPFIRFANEVVIPKRKKSAYCADCRLIFITDGEGRVNINNKNFDFKAGSLLFWQPKTLYRFIFKSCVKAFVIDFDLFYNGKNSKEIIPLLERDSSEFKQTEFLVYNFSDSSALNSPIVINNAFFLQEKINQIVIEFKKQSSFGIANACAYLKLSISKISESIVLKEKASEITKKINILCDYIHQNFSCDLSNTSLAELIGYHPYYLNRIFKQINGYSLHQYILNCRLSAATELLLSSSFEISVIAEKCGFNNPISFINAFKKKYTLTPTQFRNRTL